MLLVVEPNSFSFLGTERKKDEFSTMDSFACELAIITTHATTSLALPQLSCQIIAREGQAVDLALEIGDLAAAVGIRLQPHAGRHGERHVVRLPLSKDRDFGLTR